MPITSFVGNRQFNLSLHSPRRTASRPRTEPCFPRTVSMAAVLVPVRLEEVEQQGRLLSYAVTTAKSRVFLYLTGAREQIRVAHCVSAPAQGRTDLQMQLFKCGTVRRSPSDAGPHACSSGLSSPLLRPSGTLETQL